MISVVLDEDTGELMDYRRLMKIQNTANYIATTMPKRWANYHR